VVGGGEKRKPAGGKVRFKKKEELGADFEAGKGLGVHRRRLSYFGKCLRIRTETRKIGEGGDEGREGERERGKGIWVKRSARGGTRQGAAVREQKGASRSLYHNGERSRDRAGGADISQLAEG